MKTDEHQLQSKSGRKKRRWFFPMGMLVVYWAVYWVSPDRTISALLASLAVLKQMALPLAFAFAMMVGLNLFVTPAHVTRFLGKRAEITGVFFSSAAGILSMGPVYAWLPLLAAIRKKGASDFCLATFLSSRAVKPVLLPLMISYFGWRFSLIFTAFNIAGALVVAAMVSWLTTNHKK